MVQTRKQADLRPCVLSRRPDVPSEARFDQGREREKARPTAEQFGADGLDFVEGAVEARDGSVLLDDTPRMHGRIPVDSRMATARAREGLAQIGHDRSQKDQRLNCLVKREDASRSEPFR